MHIRDAMAQDAPMISRIIARSWRGAYQGLIDPVYLSRLPEEYWLPSMRTWLESGRMYGYIAETEGEPVGCVICGRGRDEDHADWGEIASLLPNSCSTCCRALLRLTPRLFRTRAATPSPSRISPSRMCSVPT